MANRRSIETAGYKSFRDAQGMDPEQAEDLGFATPENYADQVASGKKVGRLVTQTVVQTEDDGWSPGDKYKGFEHGVDETAWSNLSEEQKAINQRGIDQVRAILNNPNNTDK